MWVKTAAMGGLAVLLAARLEDDGHNMFGLLESKFSPVVEGNNSCFMSASHVDEAVLEKMLPAELSVPDSKVLQEAFPQLGVSRGKVPFMLSFCHGSNCHDVFTRLNVPEQEELMFVFPVMYKGQLCSWIPVLYLDSFLGVIGGLYYGLRKQWHPSQIGWFHTIDNSPNDKSWKVKDVIDASFSSSGEVVDLPHFFAKLFDNPFVTLSYANNYVLYKAEIYPTKVSKAKQERLHWRYWNTDFKDSVLSVFAEYYFTMGLPISGDKWGF